VTWDDDRLHKPVATALLPATQSRQRICAFRNRSADTNALTPRSEDHNPPPDALTRCNGGNGTREMRFSQAGTYKAGHWAGC
jgi:hypothetical protein